MQEFPDPSASPSPAIERFSRGAVDWSPVKAFIKNLSLPTEFCLVVFMCFGMPIVDNTAWVVTHLWPAPGPPPVVETREIHNGDIVFLAVFEVVTLALVLSLGRLRGWSLTTLGLRPSWKWTGLGVLVFVAFGLIGGLIRWMAAAFFQSPVDFHRTSHITLPVVVLICIVNPVFEETLECSYFFRALQGRGLGLTVLVSAGFRGFLHTTMGMSGFVFMFAEGLLHGFCYWRWRQLWPLIIAHALQMLHALLPPALGAVN